MKNKVLSNLIIVVVVVVAAIAGYAIFHKSPKTPANNSTNNNTSTVNNVVVITKNSSSVGNYLADPNGNTLYTYSSDSSGVSNCTGSCLSSWPAYQDKGATTGLPTDVSTFKRTDNGETQYTYNGLPLYYFVSDSKDQVTGNGVQGFKVAKPVASSSSSSNNTPSGGYSY